MRVNQIDEWNFSDSVLAFELKKSLGKKSRNRKKFIGNNQWAVNKREQYPFGNLVYPFGNLIYPFKY